MSDKSDYIQGFSTCLNVIFAVLVLGTDGITGGVFSRVMHSKRKTIQHTLELVIEQFYHGLF